MISIGIALGAGRLRAALPGGRCLETASPPVPLSANAERGDDRPVSADVSDVTATIADLKRTLGIPRALVTVALLPPLVDVRRVDLPPLRDEERRRVLTRDAARHFLGARTPQVIGIAAGVPLVAAADAALIESVERAIEAAGWSLRAIVPAHVAWAHAARDTAVVRLGETIELLRAQNGRLLERRRLRRSDPLPEARELDPYEVAARCAPQARSLELCSAGRRASLQRMVRRTAQVLAAAAAVCFIATGAVDYWGLGRELETLRARRAAIAPHVETAMQVRDSLLTVSGTIAALDAIERATPSWPALLAELADYLPRDAYLATFQTRGDSVSIAGVAREAGAVLRELGRVGIISGLRAEGAIRQEVSSTGSVREHFRLAAQWRP